jgi:hypothetical protein
MFNRSPACEFWGAFPLEHSSYISLEGTDDYAVSLQVLTPIIESYINYHPQHSLAQELAPLKQLATLRIGIYLAPSNIVLAHRVFHTRQSAAPQEFNWEHALMIHGGIQEVPNETPSPGSISALVALLHEPSEKIFALDSCSFCREGFLQDRTHAERRANEILRGATNIKTISWMDWFSDSHLGLR